MLQEELKPLCAWFRCVCVEGPWIAQL